MLFSHYYCISLFSPPSNLLVVIEVIDLHVTSLLIRFRTSCAVTEKREANVGVNLVGRPLIKLM
jgi:hypothetical protein